MNQLISELNSWSSVTSEANKFKYQHKERDLETGYDYDVYPELSRSKARLYDSGLGRFMQVDPMAEKYPTMSSFSAMANNPLFFGDPTGMGVIAKIVRTALEKKAFSLARRKAVRQAWRQEFLRVSKGKDPSMALNDKELKYLLETKGRKGIPGWKGHHINSVASHDLEMAANPNNIKFVKDHLAEHKGKYQNQTSGELIERISSLEGPFLLVFVTAFNAKLEEITSESDLYADPDSWLSYINPYNSIAENIALAYALTEAIGAQEKAEKEKSKSNGKKNFQTMTNEEKEAVVEEGRDFMRGEY